MEEKNGSLQQLLDLITDKGVYTLENNGTVTITWEHWGRKEKLFAQLFETKNAYFTTDV